MDFKCFTNARTRTRTLARTRRCFIDSIYVRENVLYIIYLPFSVERFARVDGIVRFKRNWLKHACVTHIWHILLKLWCDAHELKWKIKAHTSILFLQHNESINVWINRSLNYPRNEARSFLSCCCCFEL